jgi:hypothetical protein
MVTDPNRISISHSSRLVLEGVPRIGEDVDEHLCPFPGALYAYLEYVGDPQDYDYLMGVTGAAFRRFWNRDDGGNIDLSYLGDEPFRRVFDALGYEWRKVPPDKEAMIQAIKASLAQGRPAISFGIIGPPEAGLVTGYAEDGAVLYGWSYFQDWPEFQQKRDTYYEKRDWFETMDKNAGKGLILVGDRLPSRPAARDVLVASLEWAIDLERTAQRPGRPDHVTGLAAYDAWADALEVDADYPPDEPGTMGLRMMVYGNQCVMLEERHEAARFLRRMKAFAPQAAGYLEDATALYDDVGDRVTPLWPWPIDPSAGAMRALADARTRRELAGHVRAARAKEAEAVEHLERVLAELR